MQGTLPMASTFQISAPQTSVVSPLREIPMAIPASSSLPTAPPPQMTSTTATAPAIPVAYAQPMPSAPQMGDHFQSVSGGIMVCVTMARSTSGFRCVRHYSPLLIPYIHQRLFFQELDQAEKIASKTTNGRFEKFFLMAAFAAGVLVMTLSGTRRSSNHSDFQSHFTTTKFPTGVMVGMAICLFSLVLFAITLVRQTKQKSSMQELENHLVNNVSTKYPALNWTLGYDQVVSNTHSSCSPSIVIGTNRNRRPGSASNVPKIIIQVMEGV